MLTVTKLARRCGLSRSTLLYYESIGLMRPVARSAGNYRCYGESDVMRLRQICYYRDAGLKLEDVRAILDHRQTDVSRVLERRLAELNGEIATLRKHQQSILKLLQNRTLRRTKVITKQKWVEIMSASGFSPEQMHRWHREFEKSAPAEHQEFLEFLHIPASEINSIRQWSRNEKEGETTARR
jgi:DNA-binding transcriptional MerR regulator